MNKKILIVDDDVSTCKILELVLGKKGYDVRTVNSGNAAILENRVQFFDIAMMDIHLPDREGIELLSHFKKVCPGTAVVMITGDSSAENAIRALNEGADAYITKPFNMEYVEHILDQVVEKLKLREDNLLLNRKLQQELGEKIRAEATLINNLSFIQKLINIFPSPIFYKDAKGCYQGCNTAFEKYVGKSQEEIIGKTDRDIAPGDSEKQILSDGDGVIRNEDEQEQEASIQYADGTVHHMLVKKAFYTDSADKPAGQFCIMVDITGRKNAEKERLRLSTAIEQATESIVITDKDSIMQYVNPAVEKVTGYSREELIGKKPSILKSGRHPESFYQEMWQTLSEGRVWTGHLVNKRKDGSLYEEEASITPVKDNLGNISNYVAVKRDVTEEVRQRKQLQVAQKMEAIGTLAGGIAHDFNNILAAIMGYSELAQDELPKGSRVRSHFDEIHKASIRAKELVHQILTISRQDEYEKYPAQIHLIMKEVVKLMRATLPASIEIKTEIVKCRSVLADATQIHQVLMNLCTNAYHAMSDTGGILELSLREVQFEFSIIVGEIMLLPGDYVEIAVQDSGHGIDEKTIGRIFDPYFTTKPKEKGTGLGLSIVYSIIQQHNGAIRVQSKVGKGTVFQTFLPVYTDTMKKKAPDRKRIPGGNEKILIVDDEPQLAGLGEKMLSPLGYAVEIFASAEEALNAFQARPEYFDLVITDMAMPKISGIQLAASLRNIRKNIPILLCTGFSEQVTDDVLKQAGISKMMLKPLSKSELASAVRTMLDAE
ncbi:MAG: response regulator [Pseudomonadota bacterium]